MKKILLLNVFGVDKPGITSEVMTVLARFNADILDIGQAVIHDQLNLGVLAALVDGQTESMVVSKISERMVVLDMRVKCFSIAPERYSNWVDQQGKPRHVVTLLARKLESRHLAAITQVMSGVGLNIDKITRLSGRVPLKKDEVLRRTCIEFSARGTPNNLDHFRRSLLELAGAYNIDLAYQEDNIYRRNRQLIVFDMDSTLIDAEVIDELAKEMGVGRQVALITAAAMRGDIDFDESFRQRLALIKGLDFKALNSVANRLSLNEGAEYLVRRLSQLGFKTAIVSGGFDYFARYLQSILGVDYIFANELEIEKGLVTGRIKGPIIDGHRKAELLRELAKKEGLRLEQVIAVGDGANDLPMLAIAGLGIAFRAKPIVKATARQSISNLGLDGILYLLGYSDREIKCLDD